jgi:hypothetical protein
VRPPTTTTAAVAVLLVALAGLAACGDDGGGEGSTASPTTATAPRATSAPDTTAPEPVSDEEAVLAAVQCYWDTIVEANDPPDPDHPGFDRCMTGSTLERVRADVAETGRLGQTVSDPDGILRSGTQVTIHLSGDATVTECFVDDAVLQDARTGLVLNDQVRSYQVEFHLVEVDEAWLVDRNLAHEVVEGPDGCDA